VPVWSDESVQDLQECFADTDWDVFKNSCTDINELTETVSSYISFCENMFVPKKSRLLYANNKQWVSKSVKKLINQRNIYFNQGDTQQYRELSKQVKRELKLAKFTYKDKVENLLTAGNARPAWEGVKNMMGMPTKKSIVSLNGINDSRLSNEFNVFFNRYDEHNFSKEVSVFKDNACTPPNVHIDKCAVIKAFRSVKERKSPGPDHIGGRLLKNCAVQLADIFTYIFQLRLHLVSLLFHIKVQNCGIHYPLNLKQ
jgi:hypothetical protein